MARPIDLALFYRTLAELLDAGVPMTGALARAGSLLPGAGGLDVQIERGATLTQALETAPAGFPPTHRRLIAAGEASGRIEPVLRRLASFCLLRLDGKVGACLQAMRNAGAGTTH